MCLHPQYNSSAKIEKYLKRWSMVSAYVAAKKLICLGCGNDIMDWKRPQRSANVLINSSCFKNILARDVRTFRFMGGPPGHRRLFQGSMLMFLVDRLLYSEIV